MSLGEKIPVIFDAKSQGFNKVRADIAAADTAIGKAKAGAKGFGDMLRANVATAATAAGTALVTFGVQSVKAFQESALAAGEFADATGLGVEDASRWLEVASDIGVEAGTIQGAFAKMNKSIADGKDAWSQYGVQIARTKDGLVDANATFVSALSTIGAIEDPTLRAKAAQEVFGKSYTEVAELMAMSSNDLQAALKGVSDEQVVTDEKLAKARELRASLDNLSDAATRLQLAFGEALVPAINDAAKSAQDLVDSPLIGWLGQASGAIDKVTIDIGDLGTGFRVAGEAIDIALGKDVPGELANWEKGAAGAADATRDLAAAFGLVDGAAAGALAGGIGALERDLQAAEGWLNTTKAIEDYKQVLQSTTATAAEKQSAVVSLNQQLLAYIGTLDDIPPEKMTEILAALANGDLARIEALLNAVTRPRIVQVGIAINQGAIAGAAAGAAGPIGQGIGASIAAAIAGVKMPSSVTGGGGGGGGGGSSPAAVEATSWADAIARAYEYGEITRDEYRKYLSDRIAGEEKYGDAYDKTWKEIQSLDRSAADERKAANDERVRAEKEAADIAKKAADDAERQAQRQQELQALRDGARAGMLEGFSGMRSVTNIVTNNPETILQSMRGYERNNGPAWLPVSGT